MKFAMKFELISLMDRCEEALMSSVTVQNCIMFYKAADEINAETLKSHCYKLISNHWHDFTSDDFADVNDLSLFKMLKAKNEYSLHTAIKLCREDVVFYFLSDYSYQLPSKLNEIDDSGVTPLDLALCTRQEGIAKLLVSHFADIDQRDNKGRSLLHKAVIRGDEFSALFLIENNASVNLTIPVENTTALHLVAGYSPKQVSKEIMDGMVNVASKLLEHSADPCMKDKCGNTCLHHCILTQNAPIFELLLKHTCLSIEKVGNDAPQIASLDSGIVGYDDSFAAELMKSGCNLNDVNSLTGDTLLHLACKACHEDVGIFLAVHGANPNLTNNKGESPLHISCAKGLSRLTKVLLQKGGNPNLQTFAPNSVGCESLEEKVIFRQTPVHFAVLGQHEHIVQLLIEHKAYAETITDGTVAVPDFNIKNSKDQTPFSLAIEIGLYEVAQKLLYAGACINITNSEGLTLLHQAIMNQDNRGVFLLIKNGVDMNAKTPDGINPISLALKHNMPLAEASLRKTVNEGCDDLLSIVETKQDVSMEIDFTSDDFADMDDLSLFRMLKAKEKYSLHTAVKIHREDVVFFILSDYSFQLPSKLNEIDNNGDIPLDLALRTKQKGIARLLVSHYANVDQRDHEGRSLLHKAVIRGDEFSAVFLIENNASVNLTIPVENTTPLHLVAGFSPKEVSKEIMDGMVEVANKLLEHSADPCLTDNSGNTCLHNCILAQNAPVFELLLKHKYLSLEIRNAARQMVSVDSDTGGYDESSFAAKLVKSGCNLNDAIHLNGDTLLHLACKASNEDVGIFLVKHGANPNIANNKGESPLHISCARGLSRLTTLLLQKGGNPNLQTFASSSVENVSPEEKDVVFHQTPLHFAILGKHEEIVQLLIEHKTHTETTTDDNVAIPDLDIKNSKEQTPLSLAMEVGLYVAAEKLLSAGACVNITNSEGLTLLHQTIMSRNNRGVYLLLKNGADVNIKTPDGTTPLSLAARRNVLVVQHILWKTIGESDSDSDSEEEDDSLSTTAEARQDNVPIIKLSKDIEEKTPMYTGMGDQNQITVTSLSCSDEDISKVNKQVETPFETETKLPLAPLPEENTHYARRITKCTMGSLRGKFKKGPNTEKKQTRACTYECVVKSGGKCIYAGDSISDQYSHSAWLDLVESIENKGSLDETRQTYIHATAKVPQTKEKSSWEKYILLWRKYAEFMELKVKSVEKTRHVFRKCLNLVPHEKFTFSNLWLDAAKFEIRQEKFSLFRTILDRAIKLCPRGSIFQEYIELETNLKEFEHCRSLYEKFLQYYEKKFLAEKKSHFHKKALDNSRKLSAVYQQYIKFEIRQEESTRARNLYVRQLENPDLKSFEVWKDYVKFELRIHRFFPAVQKTEEEYKEICKILVESNVGEQHKKFLETWHKLKDETHTSSSMLSENEPKDYPELYNSLLAAAQKAFPEVAYL